MRQLLDDGEQGAERIAALRSQTPPAVLRSLEMYAPFIRNIHIVTDGQTPAWLNTDAAGIQIVDHKDIFSDPDVLPVFNSHAIETQLHHIPVKGVFIAVRWLT